jgi:psiF repeat
MKKLIAALGCAFLAASSAALAQDKAKKEPTEKQKAQQERMKDCNAKMGDKKGDERKKAMSSCLKGEEPGASDKQKAQQQKMKDCNKQAADKKMQGDARKGFMSSCLKG